MQIADFLDQVSKIVVSNIVPIESFKVPTDADLFVGCSKDDSATGGSGPDRLGYIDLNNKSVKTRFGGSYLGVTALALKPPPALLASWPLLQEAPLAPQAALDRIQMVVEDASPDSVFGVLLFLARLAGVDPASLPAAWEEAVLVWETDGNAPTVFGSWCALESALAHSHYAVGTAVSEQNYSAAWTDSLRFLAKCLAAGFDPNAIPDRPDIPEWRLAVSALHQEAETYANWLQHTIMVQLALPCSPARERFKVVDALLFVEDQATGAAKLFYRNDTEHSALGNGFAFAASFRPGEEGTGDDITITIDPRTGLRLDDLWTALEACETAKWESDGEERPSDNPRGIRNSKYNEPWYLSDNGTLIGAPRLNESGRPGLKLSWDEVKEIIWRLYNPLAHVEVATERNGATVSLLTLGQRTVPHLDPGCKNCKRAGTCRHFDKHVLTTYWPIRSSDTRGQIHRSLPAIKIVPRIIAGLINGDASGDGIPLEDLPRDGAWEKVDLSGGFAIVTAGGIFVLDDWRAQSLYMEDIQEEIKKAQALDHELCKLANIDIYPLAETVALKLDGGKVSASIWTLRRQATKLNARLSAVRGNLAFPSGDTDAQLLRDALDRQWRLEARLTFLETELQAIDTSLKALLDMRGARITHIFGTFGSAIYFAGALTNPIVTSIKINGFPFEPLVVFCGLFTLMSAGIWLFLRWEDPLN